MNDLTVNDLSLLIHLIDNTEVADSLASARLTYIRFCLVEKAIEVNGGVDA